MWRAVLVIACAAVVLLYISVACDISGNNDNDAAYYLGVARHIVKTHRLEENIVWHYLRPPPAALHAPFDYWQGLTALFLVPVLAMSSSPHAPFVFMAVVSGTTLLLLCYLVTTAAPFRHPLSQIATLLVFAFSPAMQTYRFDTDTVAVTQLWLAAGLVAFARQRYKTVLCAAFLAAMTRGDGAIFAAILGAACLHATICSSPRKVLALVATFAALTMVYVGWNLWLHGRLIPAPVRMATRLTDYFDLYAFARQPHLGLLRSRLRVDKIFAAFWEAFDNLRETPFAPLQKVWFAMTVFWGWRNTRWGLTGVVWTMVFLGSAVDVLWAGQVFSPWRSLYPLLPLIALAGGAAMDDVIERVTGRRVRPWIDQPFRAWSIKGLSALFIAAMAHEVKPLAPTSNALASLESDLRGLRSTLGEDTVAATRPWSVIAQTDGAAVKIPIDGADSFAAAMQAYDVRWLVLSTESCERQTASTCEDIRNGTRTELGAFRLVEQPGAGTLRLFRLVRAREL